MAGMPGRSGGLNAKPPALRILEGNPGHRPIRDSPKPPPLAPTQPRWADILPGSDNARVRKDAAAEWKRVVPVLDYLGLLSTVDGALLSDYCVCWARLLQCERQLSTEGLVREVFAPLDNGEMVLVRYVRNHHSVTVKEYRSSLRSYVVELGLGPSSRGRLNTGGVEDDDTDGLLD